MENMNKSPLNILYETGVLLPFGLIRVVTPSKAVVNVYGHHYPESIKPIMSLGDVGEINICVAHRFYKYSFSSSSLSEEQVKLLGYDVYALGCGQMAPLRRKFYRRNH